MKLLNPTPELIDSKCHGINYFMQPNQTIDVNQEVGNWIMERYAKFGLVDITAKDGESIRSLIPRKIIEGLDLYINHLNIVLESYVTYDTELKSVNQFGTILKHKNVRFHTKNIEIASNMIKQVEEKHGISIRKTEIEDRANLLVASIDALIAEVESDVENVQKAKQRDAELDDMIKEILPNNVLKSSEFSISK